MSMSHAALLGLNGSCPWWSTDHGYNARGIITLHQEIEQFYRYISPTEEERQMRLKIIERISKIVQGQWPDVFVEVFGSFANGLYLPNSDLDLALICNCSKLDLHTLKDALLDAKVCNQANIQVIENGPVPIIKFTDQLYGIKVDISFKDYLLIQKILLLNNYIFHYPNLGKIVLVLKQFLMQHHLNEQHTGGISSYSLVIMTVGFLQSHQTVESSSHQNLGALLIGFFLFYGRQFNYMEMAVSLRDGGSFVARAELEKDIQMDHRRSFLYIEDPEFPDLNLARRSFRAWAVKIAFEQAYLALSRAIKTTNREQSDANLYSILGCIVSV